MSTGEVTSPRITDEAIAELQSRVGIPQPNPMPPHYFSPNSDTFRIVARAYGDDNPLWCDPSYAEASVWGEPIAPPPLVGGDTLIGEDDLSDSDRARHSDLRGDPLRGVHAFYSASEREWWSPLRANRRVLRRNALVAALDKPSDFAGRAVHEWTANLFADADGTPLAGQFRLMIRSERAEAVKRQKHGAIEPQVWTKEDIAEIDRQYSLERRRSGDARWFEDVAVGDEVWPRVKGPLSVTDIIVWHTGMGMGVYGVSALRLAYQNRMRIPRFFHRDDQGMWDTMQRVHWDPEFARRSGNPTTFDYGRMRETWLIHALTDWMGDEAWLWRLRVEFRKFNYVGDLQTITGSVTRKHLVTDEAGTHAAVDIDLACTNQRGEVTAPATATVFLPSREHGTVLLPAPAGDTAEAAMEAIVAQFSRR